MRLAQDNDADMNLDYYLSRNIFSLYLKKDIVNGFKNIQQNMYYYKN